MATMATFGIAFCGALAIGLIVMLVTGKAFNPARGMRPMIVSRSGQTASYWTSIVLYVALMGLAAWMFFVAPSSN